jgi:hypothetical protein
MMPFRIPIRFLSAAVFLSFALASLLSCGGSGIGGLAGGGTGGTGISTGAVTGFGSVVMNGAHYKTFDGPGFKTKKTVKGVDKSGQKDQDVFSVGMIVTLHYSPGDNNAEEIDYEPNLVGPVESKAPGGENPAIVVLGLPVLLDNATFHASLNPGDVVEVSGFVDNVGRIRATFAALENPAPMPGEEFEINGFISGLNPSDNTFLLGPLPDGSGNTVTVSYATGAIQGLPAGPENGRYVRVRTLDTQPVNGRITASRVTISVARTVFPENAMVDLDGMVTKLVSGIGPPLTFDLEGKPVETDGSTVFLGGAAADIQPNVRVQVHGKEIGGTLKAVEIIFR